MSASRGHDDRLAGLLAAAAAPARADELAGEQAVLAAFRARQLALSRQPRRQSMIKIALAKLLTVKAAAVAVLVTAAGGVALAATGGALPNPLGRPDTPPGAATASARPEPQGSKAHGAPASPSPSIDGLCRAYLANPTGNRGKALESPAFRALIAAAGDRDNVTTFCTDLVEVKRSGEPGRPGDAGRPSVRPARRAAAERPPRRPARHPGPAQLTLALCRTAVM